MDLVYEGEDYTFDLEEIDVRQALIIHDKCGLTLMGLEEGLTQGNPFALRAMFWLMLCQNGKEQNIETVNFKIVKFARAVDEAAVKAAEAAKAARKVPGPKGKASQG